MLQRFIAFIDSLGERLNPYFVLHQRRAFRASKTWITVPIIHSLFALAALIGLVYSDLIEHRLRELPSPATFTFMSPMLSFYFVFFAFGATLAPWINYRVVKKADPLMLVTPLSKREVYFGFHQINVWGNAAFFLMLSPWLAILYHARLIPLSWATLYPFLFWFLSFTLENTLFSVSLAPNKLYQTVILGILWSVVFTACFCGSGGIFWAIMMYRLGAFGSSTVQAIIQFLTAPKCHWPILIFAMLLFNAGAWKLCDYNLEKSRPFFKKLAVSLGVYFGITLLMAGLWLLLCWQLY